jgi:Ca2+-binding RTX toxin-like protein
MHKATTMVALVVLLTAVAAGVAVALTTTTCSSVPCLGTPSADVLKERVGDGKRDVIYGGRGKDRIWAVRDGADTDTLYGGRGNDRLNVEDGDRRDRAVGGPGKRDVCFAEWGSEYSLTCEVFAGT